MPKHTARSSSRAVSRAIREEESDLLYNLVYDKLTSSFRDIELLARTTKVPIEERDSISVEALSQFLADQLVEQEFTADEIMRLVGESIDTAAKAAGVEEVEDDSTEDEEET
jgi:hypothetical protein